MANVEGEPKGTSPWVWVGVGCVAAIALLIFSCVGIGYLGYRQLRQMQATMEDPVAREAEARRVLGAERIPEGYHAVAGFSVPFLMQMAMLSDRSPGEEGRPRGFDERGFLYVRMLSFGQQEQELEDFIEGRSDDPGVLEQQDAVDFRRDEILARGVIEEADRTLRWVGYRGSIDSRSTAAKPSLMSMVLIDCLEDDRTRIGIWFGPDPAPQAATEDLDLSGTVVDEATLAAFFSNFDVCDL